VSSPLPATWTGDGLPQRRPSPDPLMNPYLAGVGLGLVLLASFVVMGRGLGASGAFNSFLAWIVQLLSPEHASGNTVYADYLGDGHPLKAWLVILVAGLFLGALASGWLANRAALVVERGPRAGVPDRLGFAFIGGALAGVGAKLALGCTSGQALTGGALLNAGSWTFMMMVFAGGYGAAWFVRKQWT
jgi:uncharacterized membrane protein YedE/YeeE